MQKVRKKQIILEPAVDASPSEIKTWMKCRALWVYKYVLDRSRTTSRALAFGGVAHDAIARAAVAIPQLEPQDDPRAALALIIKDSVWKLKGQLSDETLSEIESSVSSTILRYMKRYGAGLDAILLPEVVFDHIPIFENGIFAGFIHGRFDGVMSEPDGVWILERKTGKQHKTKHLEIDLQFDLYSLAGAKLWGPRFRGIIHDFIRSKRSKTREPFIRTKVIRTDAELALIEDNVGRILRAMARTSPDDLFFHFHKDCSWCSFLPVCRRVRHAQNPWKFLLSQYPLRPPEHRTRSRADVESNDSHQSCSGSTKGHPGAGTSKAEPATRS